MKTWYAKAIVRFRFVGSGDDSVLPKHRPRARIDDPVKGSLAHAIVRFTVPSHVEAPCLGPAPPRSLRCPDAIMDSRSARRNSRESRSRRKRSSASWSAATAPVTPRSTTRRHRTLTPAIEPPDPPSPSSGGGASFISMSASAMPWVDTLWLRFCPAPGPPRREASVIDRKEACPERRSRGACRACYARVRRRI